MHPTLRNHLAAETARGLRRILSTIRILTTSPTARDVATEILSSVAKLIAAIEAEWEAHAETQDRVCLTCGLHPCVCPPLTSEPIDE